jgi:MoaA/NifB/PqqE/SkfB family radical SAM enzyme
MGSNLLGNIKKESITNIVESPKLAQIKQDLLDNHSNDNCKSCYESEKNSGIASLRNHFNLHHPDIDKGLQFLDLRWSNLCNLNCIYCDPGQSSSWQDKLYPHTDKVIKNPYDKELEEWVLSKSTQIHELILIGGEPLLMKQNISLLNKISDNARISIITNLSYNLSTNPCAELLFKRPSDNTLWNISVENYGDRFEYIRTGADWNQFETNLKLLVERAPNTVNLLMVYGIFSALNLFDTVKMYHSMGIKKIQVNMLLGNPALDIFKFPMSIIEIARDQMQKVLEWQKETYSIDYDLYKCHDIEHILARLDEIIYNNSHQIISKSKFIEEIEKYDRWTKRKFADLWTDEYNLIMKELND